MRIIGTFHCPNLHTLDIHLNDEKSTELLILLSRFNHIKCLKIIEGETTRDLVFQPPKFDRHQLRDLKLDELKTVGFGANFLKWLLGTIKCPKKVKFETGVNATDIALPYKILQNLKHLEIDDFDGDFGKFSPLVNLKSLKIERPIDERSEKYRKKLSVIPPSMKNLRHFSFFECNVKNFGFLMRVLKKFKKLESFEVNERRLVSREITEFFLDADFVNKNMKTLKLNLSLPFSSQLYEKLVKMFPNVENLEIKSAWMLEFEVSSYEKRKNENVCKNEVKKFELLLKVFYDKNRDEFFRLLSKIDFKKLSSDELTKTQVCIFQLGFVKLRTLKFNFGSQPCVGLEDLVKENKQLQSFEISCWMEVSPSDELEITTAVYDRKTNSFGVVNGMEIDKSLFNCEMVR
jgi:hypothetical protein